MAIKTWWADLPNETLVETAWERQMNLSGLEAYEMARTGKASTTATGQRFMRKLIAQADDAIIEMQKKVINLRRVDRNLKATVIVVPSDTLALLCLKPMIDGTYSASDPSIGIGYQTLSESIAKAVELELNFRHWVESSRQTAREYAEANGLTKVPPSTAERLIADQGVSRQSLWNWKRTFADLSEYKWDTLEKHYCGDALLSSVAAGLPEYFEVHFMSRAHQNKKWVRMTPAFREKFDNMEYHTASVQMQKKPMLARPKKWEATE